MRATLVAIAGVGAIASLSWPFTVDDAFITARYAGRVAEGLGYTFHDGPPTDGVTGPLWLLPLVAAEWAGFDAVVTAKLFGAGCTLAAVGLVVVRLRRRALGRRAAWVATLLMGVSATIGVWSVAGLETGAATLVFTMLGLQLLERRTPITDPLGARPSPPWPRVVTGALLASCVPALRPELTMATVVLAGGFAALFPRRGFAVGLGLVAGLGAMVVFRLSMFGSALPLAASAKPGEFVHGLGYVGAGALLTLGALVPLIAVAAFHGALRIRVAALAVAVHIAAVAAAGGDWMPGFRLLAPVLPLAGYLAAVGAARLSLRRRSLMVALGCVGVSILVSGLDLAANLPRMREAGATQEQAGGQLRASLEGVTSVALVDIGYASYRQPFRVLDLGGLTDPTIARLPGGHLSKRLPTGLLETWDPEAIVLHSATRPEVVDGELRSLRGYPVEMQVARLDAVRRGYQVATVIRYAPNYHYVVLRRSE
ncbi:MAG: hypothetical protein AAGF12_22615 [Myxococcota bacterium]